MDFISEETWDRIYHLYYRKTYFVALGITKDPELAKDVAHDAFFEAYKSINKLRDINKLGAWIAGIAVKIARTQVRRDSRMIPSETVEMELAQTMENLLEDAVASKELRQAMISVVLELPLEFQQVVFLRYYYDLEYGEISSVLNISMGTVKSRLNRAHGKLRNKLEGTFLRQEGDHSREVL